MLEIGSLVDGKYKILSEIGHGGMSIVYMALNEKVNKTWAVKEVRKDGKIDFNFVRQGLITETETLKRLKHPNLPSLVDVIEDRDSFIIVMDYIEGRSLDVIMDETGAQPQADVVKWAIQLCDVLGYLHTRRPPIIYRDMKPANVMLKPDGNIMLIDFGTAKNYDMEIGSEGHTTGIGTRGYAAPEQYIGSGLARTDARTDIYSLGVTMYQLLTNVNPCKEMIDSNWSIRSVNPSLSYGLDEIIRKCTQYTPDNRYQSCAELMFDLEHYSELDRLYRKRQKRKLWAFAASAVLAAAFACSGSGLKIAAAQRATETYDSKLEEAAASLDYDEKLALYEECITIPGKAGQKDAYLDMIQIFKENDGTDIAFTQDEANLLTRYIQNNADALKADTSSYEEVCFETEKLFWYYYQGTDASSSSNQYTGAIQSVYWFDQVSEGSDNYAMANVYKNIGEFNRDNAQAVLEADDRGQYAPLFENLEELLASVARNDEEDEIVRLELLEMARSAIEQYANKFRIDGIDEDRLLEMYNTVADTVASIATTSDSTSEIKAETTSHLDDTKKAIETAFRAAGGSAS